MMWDHLNAPTKDRELGPSDRTRQDPVGMQLPSHQGADKALGSGAYTKVFKCELLARLEDLAHSTSQ